MKTSSRISIVNPVRLLRNAKVSRKILILNLFALLALVLVVLNAAILQDTSNLRHENLYKEEILPMNLIGQADSFSRTIDSLLLEHVLNNDEAGQKELEGAILNMQGLVMERIKQYEEAVGNNDGLSAQMEAVHQSQKNLLGLSYENKTDEAYEYYANSVMPSMKALGGQIQGLLESHIASTEETQQETSDTTGRNITIMIVSNLIVAAIFMLFGFFISRLISKPLKQIEQAMAKASAGDLTTSVTYSSKDELGMLSDSFNTMMQSLRHLIGQANDVALNLSGSSEELSASSDQSKKAAEQIAYSTTQLSEGMEQQVEKAGYAAGSVKLLSRSMSGIADNSSEVDRLAQQARSASQKGEKAVGEVLHSMDDIQRSTMEASEIVELLSRRSAEIQSIVGMISEIANQTNLLSLNASIEAARAGEAGRGFLVVAGEVKKLAEQSSVSADQIKELVYSIQKETDRALGSMAHNAEIVQQGSVRVRDFNDIFTGITGTVTSVSGKVRDVNDAIVQMKQEMDRVVDMVNTVDHVAKQGASASQETAAANEEQLATMDEMSRNAHSLARLAEELQGSLLRFKL